MPKQQRKARVKESSEDSPQAHRTIWLLGKEIKSNDAEPELQELPAFEEDPSEEIVADDSRDRRPSQLEAYMRYAKMREPEEELADVPIRSRRSPDSGYEDDMRWSERNYGRRARRRRSGIRLRDALLAGFASIAVGAAAGSIVYDRANDGVLSSVAFDVVGDFMTGLKIDDNAFASVARPTLVDPQEAETVAASFKKPVATASLNVSDATGNVNSPIPLSISAEPALPNQDIALRLSGLPDDAYLTAGTKLPNNAWILRPVEAVGVKLMVLRAQPSPLLIAVDAIEPRTGDLAAPTEEMSVAITVGPVSAPPMDIKRNFNLPPMVQKQNAAAQPIPAPIEKSGEPPVDSASLMRNGDKLLGLGDFTAARAFFNKARDLGNREASLRLGQTYDPVVFRDRNVQGLKPDPAMALKYYLEARTAGIGDADSAITGLESWLKK